jgi:hypothetical protein
MGSKIKFPEPDKSTQKLKELILYISKHSMKDERFGSTKLNKLLFYCDFEAYKRFGKAITGKSYMNLNEGPVPRCLLPVRTEMIKTDKTLILSAATYFDLHQERPVPLRDPDVRVFTPQELELVNETLSRYWDYNGTEISRESHKFIGWRITELNEDIDYKLALIGNRLPTEKEIRYAYTLQASL